MVPQDCRHHLKSTSKPLQPFSGILLEDGGEGKSAQKVESQVVLPLVQFALRGKWPGLQSLVDLWTWVASQGLGTNMTGALVTKKCGKQVCEWL